MNRYLILSSVIFVAGCAETTYWAKPGGNQFQFDREQAACHNQAYFLPRVETPETPPSYQIDTTRLGSSYYSTVTPYSNPYQNMADAFSSLGDTLANLAIKEKFLENCMVSKGWRKVEKNAVALTVSAYAIVGSKEAVYEGSATGYPDNTGTIKMKSEDGSVCVGNFRYIDSRGGNGLVRCDDGASAKITFTAITNSSGYGSGTSDQGEVVKFVYGLEGEEKNKFLKTSVGETRALAEQGNPVAVGERDLAAIFEKAMQAYERGNKASRCDFSAGVRESVEADRMLRPLADQLRPLAEQGDGESQYMLGKMYGNGLGVTRDDSEAVKWYRKAANQGHVKAQFHLGNHYYAGLFGGVNQDYAEAMKWFSKAAERGDAEAQVWLGIMYLRGEGVVADDAEASTLFHKAAEQGEADAYSFLGTLYSSGSGVKQDYAEAAKWYRKSAAQGDMVSQISLGEAYVSGQGVSRDYGAAAFWFRNAAEAGYVEAQVYLGELYYDGRGVPQDYVEAHKWWNLAASRYPPGQQRNQSVLLRDKVTQQMTPDQIAEAQRLAREWKPKRCGVFGSGNQ